MRLPAANRPFGHPLRVLKNKDVKRSKTLVALALAAILVATPQGYAPLYAAGATKNAPQIKTGVDVPLGKSTLVAVPREATDVIVADPDIVAVSAIKDNRLNLTGAALGDTNILLLDENGDTRAELSVHVHMDVAKVEEALKTELPGQNIKVSSIGDQIILSGPVGDAASAAHAQDIAQRFETAGKTVVNNLRVVGNQQVMIQVKVVEVARNVLNELGIETDASGVGGHTLGFTGTTTDSLGLTVTPSFGTGSLVFSRNGTGPITLAMRALEREGLVNTLAEPNLTAISGENARFLAGGEYPAPSGLDSQGNLTYEYKPFGVSLSFKPVVLNDDRINLQIATEVSEVSTELTLEISGVVVPSFTVRRAETTVELASGGSLMIAGIIQSKSLEKMNKLPGISNVPIIGDLVRSESFTRNETELVVMITAYLVEPFAQPNAEEIENKTPQEEPLNRALAEALAIQYGESVRTYAEARPFGYIME